MATMKLFNLKETQLNISKLAKYIKTKRILKKKIKLLFFLPLLRI